VEAKIYRETGEEFEARESMEEGVDKDRETEEGLKARESMEEGFDKDRETG
jgi:hypothetical protein